MNTFSKFIAAKLARILQSAKKGGKFQATFQFY